MQRPNAEVERGFDECDAVYGVSARAAEHVNLIFARASRMLTDILCRVAEVSSSATRAPGPNGEQLMLRTMAENDHAIDPC